MKTNFCTKRNANGYRKILIIDHEKKEFSRESTRWYCREDFVEVNIADFRKMQQQAEKAGYKELERMNP